MRVILLVVALLLFALPAKAQSMPQGLSYKDTAVALTTASSCPTVSAENGSRKGLTLDNTGGSVNVGYCIAAPGASSCTAAIGTAPTTTLAAGVLHSWPFGAPQNRFCFIAASGTPSFKWSEGQ